MRLYTLHEKPGHDLRAIADRMDPFAFVLPPVWLIWHRLWWTALALLALTATVGALAPLASPAMLYGIGAVLALEGGAVKRLELRLWGWREVGVVEARTEEGAEELYLEGRTA